VTGVALGARVTGDEARTALELLALVDADADPGDPFEGRIIERVKGGWRVLGFEQSRETAKAEGRRARTRQYMRNARARVANDVTPSDPVASTVTPPIPKPKPIPKPRREGEGSPLPPSGGSAAAALTDELSLAADPESPPPTEKAPPSRDVAPQSTNEVGVLPAVIRSVPSDWSAPEELVAEAIMAGLTRESFDRRLADLRLGPIGGARGVLAHQLESYIRSFFGKWKAWEETDRAKARAAAAAPPSSRRQFIPPTPEPKPKHVNYAKAHGIDLKAVVADLAERKVFETLGEQSYFTNLERALAKERKRKSGEAA
jgi:hypothetical protein